MNEQNARRLDALLAKLNPEQFDYGESNPTSQCGCVAWLIARQPDVRALHTAREDTSPKGGIMFTERTIAEFLELEFSDAKHIFLNRDLDFTKGVHGILDARSRLREIALKNGIDLDSNAPEPPEPADRLPESLRNTLTELIKDLRRPVQP
jgi:hypothetical protein